MLSCSSTFHFQSAQRNSGTTVTLYRYYRIKAIKSKLRNKETKIQQANAKLEVPRRMWKHVIAAMHEYCNAPRSKIATNKQKLTANIFTHRSVPAPQDVLVGGLVLFLWTSFTLFAKPFYYLILFLMISRDHSSVLIQHYAIKHNLNSLLFDVSYLEIYHVERCQAIKSLYD